MSDIDNCQDIVDVRDIIARLEELEADQPLESDEDLAELDELKVLLDELKGNGGDEQWQGDWYPVTLIRDSYFTEYAQGLAEELGVIPEEYVWPISYIDWDLAARDLQMDYTSVEYDGITYWYR